ncbi:GntR family transcriptional regulator [Jiella sonneratiae]|uniref:GntR family transcriptional regulator n=1 Tax=Jiella sonneratiae TaxID=2816856 RepID=A0ABS3IZK4_9HYPH|nr:GntR family transcriptional regulator [Jiella sonneratiae]MBO0902840.1 GntR family transcriptional regulator [Jiella sonneratiae]
MAQAQATASATLPRRYEVVAEVLRQNIREGRIPRGTVLLEGPLAELFRTSRAPVQRALARLEEEGVVHRFAGRGYLAGAADPKVSRRKVDLATLDLDLPFEADEGFGNRQAWRRIQATVEADVTRCLVFGQFRIVETELADHFEVSRTIVRDVLGRLQERRLVDKNASSHWVAGPLTARSIKDQFELRKILEPHGLVSAAPLLDHRQLEAARDRLRAAEGTQASDAELSALANLFVNDLVLATPNLSLRDLIRRNLHTVLISQQVLRQLGLPQDRASIVEQRMMIELLMHGAVDAAASMLSTHIEAAKQRTIAQMKIVAVIPQPISLAPYLRRTDAQSE